jgi:hypothetical protein
MKLYAVCEAATKNGLGLFFAITPSDGPNYNSKDPVETLSSISVAIPPIAKRTMVS